MTLDRVPSSIRIFLDSTILIYYSTEKSLQCRRLLERCEAREVTGVSSVIVLAEVAHRLMIIEAVNAGIVSNKDAVKKLNEQPDLVRRLHIYEEQLQRILMMGIDFKAADTATLLRSAEIRRQYGLLTNDSLIVASARGAGVEHLASADADFQRVKELKLYQPDDLA